MRRRVLCVKSTRRIFLKCCDSRSVNFKCFVVYCHWLRISNTFVCFKVLQENVKKITSAWAMNRKKSVVQQLWQSHFPLVVASRPLLYNRVLAINLIAPIQLIGQDYGGDPLIQLIYYFICQISISACESRYRWIWNYVPTTFWETSNYADTLRCIKPLGQRYRVYRLYCRIWK